MFDYRIDLHNHTPYVETDYREPSASPEDLVVAAQAAGIDVLGVTDHFSVGYCRRVIEAAECLATAGRRVLVLPGAELKVSHDGREAHLITLFPPDESFERAFESLLRVLGLPHPAAPIERLPSLTVAHDPVHVARAIEALGGMCHVGHADRRFGEASLVGTPLLERLLVESCVTAVELVNGDAPPSEIAAAGLPVIRSSDAHAPAEIGRRSTRVRMRELSFEALRFALTAGWSERSDGEVSPRPV